MHSSETARKESVPEQRERKQVRGSSAVQKGMILERKTAMGSFEVRFTAPLASRRRMIHVTRKNGNREGDVTIISTSTAAKGTRPQAKKLVALDVPVNPPTVSAHGLGSVIG